MYCKRLETSRKLLVFIFHNIWYTLDMVETKKADKIDKKRANSTKS